MVGQKEVYEKLEALGIRYDYYEHPEAPTIEIAQQFYRGEGTTLCKNLFFRNHKGNRHYLVIMDARGEMDIHRMEKSLRQGKLSFASEERMMKWIGVRPGSVSLFALENDSEKGVKLFVDKRLMGAEKVSFHPNDNRASLVITKEDMIKYIEATGNEWEVVDLAEDNDVVDK